MDENELEILKNLSKEFREFKLEINDKVNELLSKENNDFKIFEDIVCKLDDMSRLIEKSSSDTKNQLMELNETLGEKIAMLMLRKF